MKRFIILFFLIFNFIYGENTDSFLNGNANFYYISKLEDQNIINLPYRMLNLSLGHQHSQFQLLGNLAIEYQPNSNNYSFKMDDPQDFLIDLRELYMTYQLSLGEIRLGKQIQTWGFVDENSPLDNSSAYDYNFLFEAGTERKIASNSFAMDIYINNFKLGFTTTPFHSINRLPSSQADFPIDLPVVPKDYQFMDIDNVNEYGAYIQYSSNSFDIAFSYFNAYDRIFNLSGINVFETWDSFNQQINYGVVHPEPDTVLSYRNTDMLGLSAQTFLGDLSLKADFGYFSTEDKNANVNRIHPNPPNFPELADLSVVDQIYVSSPFYENSKYYQTTFQADWSINEIDFLIQYFKHDTISYSAIVPLKEGEEIAIPLFEQQGFNPYDYFFPGMGAPIALMTHNALLVGVRKNLNERLSLQLRNLIDLEYSGYFAELISKYKFSDRVNANFAINYIKGDENHPKSSSNKGSDYNRGLDYAFNQMEDYSHFRIQIKYSF